MRDEMLVLGLVRYFPSGRNQIKMFLVSRKHIITKRLRRRFSGQNLYELYSRKVLALYNISFEIARM